ncbi:MAG TPA: GNAT family N-acetyltransferase [Myxococcaceae bacterium]
MSAALEGLAVEELGAEALTAQATEWDALASASASAAPFTFSGWTRAWYESFAPGARLRLLCARRGGRAVAFAPLLERRWRLLGWPLNLWQSASNEHSQRTDWALAPGDEEEAVGALWGHLRDRGWEALLLKDIVRDGTIDRVIGAAAERDGFLVARWSSLESPWLPVVPPEELERSMDAKFRANLRRRKRKLATHGQIVLQRADSARGLDEALDEGFRLEASGWKGERGTAIACAPQTRRFYTALAKEAAERDWLSLYFLRAGARTVAFHFGLQVGGRYFLLKPGYDESLGECSPGQLLVDEVLRDLFQRGAREFDFLGPRMTWKLDWTQRLRAHCWLFVLRPTFKGRALHAARFRWGPRAARWVRGVVRRKQ